MDNLDLLKEIKECLKPDERDARWSQVECFGGGMGVEYEVGGLLYAVVRALKPEIVVETGTFKGFSTLMIAQALKENKAGHVHTIDIEDRGVHDRLRKFGLENLATVHIASSTDKIQELAKVLKWVDFLWLDSDHSEEYVKAEVHAAYPLLKSGTYIAFHDTISDFRENVAIQAIRREHPEWEYIRFSSSRGFDMMRIP